MCFGDQLCIFLGEMPIQFFCSFENGIIFFLLSCKSCLFWIPVPYLDLNMYILWVVFSLSCPWLSFEMQGCFHFDEVYLFFFFFFSFSEARGSSTLPFLLACFCTHGSSCPSSRSVLLHSGRLFSAWHVPWPSLCEAFLLTCVDMHSALCSFSVLIQPVSGHVLTSVLVTGWKLFRHLPCPVFAGSSSVLWLFLVPLTSLVRAWLPVLWNPTPSWLLC